MVIASAIEVTFIDIDIVSEIKPIIEKIAQYTTEEIKKNSPVLTGDYKEGWAYRIEKGGLSVIIYNKTDYQLTHLIEFGHISHDNGYTKPHPHIEIAYQAALKRFEDELKHIDLKLNLKKGT